MTFGFQNSFRGRQTSRLETSSSVNPFTTESLLMKTSTFVAALALSFVASGAALASGEATYEKPQVITSQVSRADVVAQLNQARANGTLLMSEADRQANPSFTSQRSRADVRTETLAAIARGEVAALNSESGTYGPAHQGKPVPAVYAGK
jgi:hypothetical protein